jgi:hypothetical protein
VFFAHSGLKLGGEIAILVANVSLMTKRLKRSAEVAETTAERLPCRGFRRTGKAMGQVYQFWWRICRERHFSSYEYHMLYVYIHM